jgi:hypothetical protein
MKKKILIISILAVFMLMAISFVSVVGKNTSDAEKKESPLYGIRTKRAIGEKISNILENIKTRFLGERIFFLKFNQPTNRDTSYEIPPLPRLSFTKQMFCSVGMCTVLISSCPLMCPTTPR